MNENKYYYQAGVVVWASAGKNKKVIWSDRVHDTKEEAVKEANRLAVEVVRDANRRGRTVYEGTPIVGYWLRKYGSRNNAPNRNIFYPGGGRI
jgi:hypothetical protein